MSAAFEAHVRRVKDEFLILDALPREWRVLVHEFGGNNTVRLFRAGFSAADAKRMLSAPKVPPT